MRTTTAAATATFDALDTPHGVEAVRRLAEAQAIDKDRALFALVAQGVRALTRCSTEEAVAAAREEIAARMDAPEVREAVFEMVWERLAG